MLRRTTDSAAFADVLEHPEVTPQVSLGQQIPDMEPIIANPVNFCLMDGEKGGFLCVSSGVNEFDVHTAFVPEARGPHLVELAIQARDYMFIKADASLLRTFVADDNLPAKRLAVAAGFKERERAELFGVPGDIMICERKDVCQ